jgi:hypothetical protein
MIGGFLMIRPSLCSFRMVSPVQIREEENQRQHVWKRAPQQNPQAKECPTSPSRNRVHRHKETPSFPRNVPNKTRHVFHERRYNNKKNQLLQPTTFQSNLRELAIEISVLSLGSSHTFRFPHLSTLAASRFCSFKETIFLQIEQPHSTRSNERHTNATRRYVSDEIGKWSEMGARPAGG